MTLRRSVLISAIVTALTFLVSFLLTTGGSSPSMAAGTLAASVDTTAVELEIPTKVVATTPETILAAPTTTAAPVVTAAPATVPVTTPPTTAKPKAVTIPVPTSVRPPAVTSATVITIPAKTTNWSVALAPIASTTTGSVAVRLVESSSNSVATVDASLSGLTEGNYVVQLSYEFGPVKTGYAVCSFVVTSETTGGCSGDLEVPEGATLLKVFVTTLHNSVGGAVAEGLVTQG